MKKRFIKLGENYFDYEFRNLIIQSVWMMQIWLQLHDEYYLKKEVEWELSEENFPNIRDWVAKEWDSEFKKDHKKMLADPEFKDFQFYFSDDPIKEGAIGFLIITAGYGDKEGRWNKPFLEEKFGENKMNFHLQSKFFYQLSLCYKYFPEIQKAVEEEFGIGVDDCFRDLDRIKEDLWYSTGDLLAYWHIDDVRKRLSQKGGSAPKRCEPIFEVLKELIPTKKLSGEQWWRWFEREHSEVDPITFGDFEIYFDRDLLWQENIDGKNRSITKGTFLDYLTDIKKITKSKK